jgi:hypothetical protein
MRAKSIFCSLVVLTLSLVLGACTKENFPKYIVLSRLRVLALQTSTPETNPGAAVTVTPYVSDVNNKGPWTYSAEGCIDAGISYGANPSCTGNSTRTVFADSQTVTSSLLNSANVYTGSVDAISISAGLTSAALTGRGVADSYNGVNYLLVYTISNSVGESVTSFRRIVITESAKATKNSNPTVTDLLAGGTSLSNLSAGTEYSLTASYGAGATETYDLKDSGGGLINMSESLFTTWFITDGDMKYYRTSSGEANTYTTPGSFPISRKSAIVGVTRDSRGGVSIIQRMVH